MKQGFGVVIKDKVVFHSLLLDFLKKELNSWIKCVVKITFKKELALITEPITLINDSMHVNFLNIYIYINFCLNHDRS